MVGAVHNKLYPFADGAEFANDEPVPNECIMMGYMGLKVLAASGSVVVVGIFADLDRGAGDDIFNVADAGNVLIGMDGVRVWSKYKVTS